MTKHCVWEYDENDYMYSTSCDQAWTFVDGNREENHVRFCPFCGGEVVEKSEATEQHRKSIEVLQKWWINTSLPVQYLSPYDYEWHDTTFPLAHLVSGMQLREKPTGIAEQPPLI